MTKPKGEPGTKPARNIRGKKTLQTYLFTKVLGLPMISFAGTKPPDKKPQVLPRISHDIPMYIINATGGGRGGVVIPT